MLVIALALGWVSTAVQTTLHTGPGLSLDWMGMLTLGESELTVITSLIAMLAVCISLWQNNIILILKTPWGLLSKESTPVACLIQLEGTLMSVLGYIVKAIVVSPTHVITA